MSDLVETRKIKNNFSGLFSKKFLEKGSIILSLGNVTSVNPTRTSIQIHKKHVEHHLGAYINHHCRPNSFVDSDKSLIVAKKDIQADEEITIDYLQTESMLAESFHCHCCDGKLILGKNSK